MVNYMTTTNNLLNNTKRSSNLCLTVRKNLTNCRLRFIECSNLVECCQQKPWHFSQVTKCVKTGRWTGTLSLCSDSNITSKDKSREKCNYNRILLSYSYTVLKSLSQKIDVHSNGNYIPARSVPSAITEPFLCRITIDHTCWIMYSAVAAGRNA